MRGSPGFLKRHKLTPPVLYGISGRSLFPTLETGRYLELLFRTRAHILQWREKDLPLERNRSFLRVGAGLAESAGKLFLANSLFEVALEEGLDGVHLNSRQSVAAARAAQQGAGVRDFLIGKSVHSASEAASAEGEGADYVLLGPIFGPYSKTSGRPPLGLRALEEAARTLSIPIVALGGMDDSREAEVIRAGAVGIAGVTWVQRELEGIL